MKKIFIGIAAIAALVVGYILISPLFINRTVDESLPTSVTDAPKAINGSVQVGVTIGGDPEQSEIDALARQLKLDSVESFKKEMADQQDEEMKEPIPEAATGQKVIAQGTFYDVAHEGRGEAKVIGLNRETILRLENLDVLNGPDLRVVLSKNTGIQSSDDLGDYLELGKLKGNIGNQNYEIDNSVNLSDYKSAVIYCKAFHVVFNVAELK